MAALRGLGDAEEKRKAFRETFYRVLEEAARREKCTYMVQGTIKADIVETVGGIKTQHNVLEQIGINPLERFGFRVIEPVASLYKYQVREVAKFLGAPREVYERQPFPGPGLSVRVVGEIAPEKLEELKKATAAVESALEEISADQYFAAIFEKAYEKEDDMVLREDAALALDVEASQIRVDVLRDRGTGMRDGKRLYGKVVTVSARDDAREVLEVELERLRRARVLHDAYPDITHVLCRIGGRDQGAYLIAARAVRTKDFITAEVADVPRTVLKKVAESVLKDCLRVSGVYFDITPKPPATIEFE